MSREMSFQRLSYPFTIRCEEPAIRGYLSHVLRRSAVPGPIEGATEYEVLDLGPSEGARRFQLRIEGATVLSSWVPTHVLDDLIRHVNLDTIEADGHLVFVHAGATATPAGAGLLLPAPSGSGKSTLVAGLVRAGFGYLSDEAAVIDPETADVLPYLVSLSLKRGSQDRFPEGAPDPTDLSFSEDTWHVDPDVIRRGSVARACEVGFVIPHRFVPGASTKVEPLTPAQACVELVQNLMLARRDAARSLSVLAEICRGSRCYRLTHGGLDAAVDAIVDLVGS